MNNEFFEYENKCRTKGYNLIAGVDEAGRGPLAGAVYAAAVIFDEGVYIEGVNDSKKLTPKKRDALYDEIISKARAWCIYSVDEKVIDEINILEATYRAFQGAINGLNPPPDYCLIDGNRSKGIEIPHETIVKGDSLSFSIAAASILAKVARDRYIEEADKLYPEYGFAAHKGYGTKAHLEAIAKYGPCPIHRLTFGGVREHVK
ncbi:MAG: ribonuclease HII [Ruminococcaceae bacterium]|nr:ribonuclease HII [Oscillospiraceae bacterium]